METRVQPPESINTTSTDGNLALEGPERETLAMLPPATESDTQWQRIQTRISNFLNRLPEYLGAFFNEYRLPIISFALVVATFLTLKVVLAIIDALDDIPLFSPICELIGIGYVTWFVFRYLLKSSTRQELAAQIQSVKAQIVGS